MELNNLRSEPVGYMDVKEMYPLDIEEFYHAVGMADHVIAKLRQCWQDKEPVDEFVHRRLMQAFRLYLVLVECRMRCRLIWIPIICKMY